MQGFQKDPAIGSGLPFLVNLSAWNLCPRDTTRRLPTSGGPLAFCLLGSTGPPLFLYFPFHSVSETPGIYRQALSPSKIGTLIAGPGTCLSVTCRAHRMVFIKL